MARMFNPTEEAGDMNFTQPPPDIYHVRIEEIERKKAQTGSVYLNLKLRVVAGEYDNCTIFETITLLEQSLWKLGELCLSCGQTEIFDIDSDQQVQDALLNRVGKVRTKWEEYEGDKRTRVKKWLTVEEEERQQINQVMGNVGTKARSDAPSGGGRQRSTPF